LRRAHKKTVKKAASDYWKEFCGTLNRTTNLSVVWNMTKLEINMHHFHGTMQYRQAP